MSHDKDNSPLAADEVEQIRLELPMCLCADFYPEHHDECPVKRAFDTLLRIVDQQSAAIEYMKDEWYSAEHIASVTEKTILPLSRELNKARAWISNAQHLVTCKSWEEIDNCTCGRDKFINDRSRCT